ncbi:hypothetical protein GIB67_034424 [Kingdonia uniflora]|uniref:Chalcone isomerase domain-containing protein n=1 Tax=Kingdonia uniflora TaxID=39325 RepID=A0A7J7PBB1_9MAGN|nr:hypothetical protein GIB67_034424 [Kingdonia uniflora]
MVDLHIFSTEPIISNSFGEALLSRVDLYDVDNSFNFQEALNCISKAAGALLLWFASGLNSHSFTSEVLACSGFISMKVIKIKSFSVYSFGLYIHPDSICEKLGPKYAYVTVNELNNRPDFYEDLLREDNHMTVRLVVNCNGLKINIVCNAFEKSLRARLLKMNPNTNYYCLKTFGSCFAQDISLPVGTSIYFWQIADGELITEINGKQIRVVHSKELCKAFFDMYIGDGPVSVQANEEIARTLMVS